MQNLLVFLFSAVAIIATVKAATDYCSNSLCDTGIKHIACGNNGQYSSACPSDAALVHLDANLKAAVVDYHNTRRNLIAGGGVSNHDRACRMATMQWDDELATLAALNVKQCFMAHDKCRNTDAFRYSGQNLAWMTYYGTPNNAAMLKQALDLWYNEVANSKMQYIKSYPTGYQGPGIGHFTIMVADRNIRVGCAANTYSVAGASSKAYLFGCNYATTNVFNMPIYASCNVAGSSCTTGLNPRYPNLCSASEIYDVNQFHQPASSQHFLLHNLNFLFY